MNYYVLMNAGLGNILYLIIGVTGAMYLIAGLKLLFKNSLILSKEMHPDRKEPAVPAFLIKFINSIFGYILVAILVIVIAGVIITTVWNKHNDMSVEPDDALSESIAGLIGENDLEYWGQTYNEHGDYTYYEYYLKNFYENKDYPRLLADTFNSCNGIDKNRRISIIVSTNIDSGAYGTVFALSNYIDNKAYDHIVGLTTGDPGMILEPEDLISDLSAYLPIEGIVDLRTDGVTLTGTLDSGMSILSYWPGLSHVYVVTKGMHPALDLTSHTVTVNSSDYNDKFEISDIEEITIIGSNGNVISPIDEIKCEYEKSSETFTFTFSQDNIFDFISETGTVYALRITDKNGEIHDLGFIPYELCE